MLGCICALYGMVVFVAASPLRGEAPLSVPAYGFVRLVNAVTAGSGGLKLKIDGKLIRAQGYQPGNLTGGMALSPGQHVLRFEGGGLRSADTTVDVAVDSTVIVIAFSELMPPAGLSPEYWAIRTIKLAHFDSGSQRTATFISVSGRGEAAIATRGMDRKWETLLLKTGVPERRPILQSRGYLPLRSKDRELASIGVGPIGNWIVVIYDDKDGQLQARVLQDYRYSSQAE